MRNTLILPEPGDPGWDEHVFHSVKHYEDVNGLGEIHPDDFTDEEFASIVYQAVTEYNQAILNHHYEMEQEQIRTHNSHAFKHTVTHIAVHMGLHVLKHLIGGRR